MSTVLKRSADVVDGGLAILNVDLCGAGDAAREKPEGESEFTASNSAESSPAGSEIQPSRRDAIPVIRHEIP